MTDKEILQKAIEKAVKNGLKLYFSHREHYQKVMNKEVPFWTANALIFSHDFAKAFFGIHGIETQPGVVTAAWIVHLQQMVLEEDPMKYLEQYL